MSIEPRPFSQERHEPTEAIPRHLLTRLQAGDWHYAFSLRDRRWIAERLDNTELRAAKALKGDAARKTEAVSNETADITLVPVQGLARAYAGHIGDACYAGLANEIALGAYPRIKAQIYVTNRGKPKERMNGSVLFVETRVAASNARVIVVRANNPRQNLVAQVDAKDLVTQTGAATIETAKRRKIKHVGVVLDHAGGASSNREEIFDAYDELYGRHDETWLANEPETNFNGYEIWKSSRLSRTVIIWTNDDPEAR
jgi:hypothetical protein